MRADPGDPGMINPQSISSFGGDASCEGTLNQQAEGPFLTAKALNCDLPASECYFHRFVLGYRSARSALDPALERNLSPRKDSRLWWISIKVCRVYTRLHWISVKVSAYGEAA